MVLLVALVGQVLVVLEVPMVFPEAVVGAVDIQEGLVDTTRPYLEMAVGAVPIIREPIRIIQ